MPRPSRRCCPRLAGSVASRRAARGAFRRFEAVGLPHRRVEDWKHRPARADAGRQTPRCAARCGGEGAGAFCRRGAGRDRGPPHRVRRRCAGARTLRSRAGAGAADFFPGRHSRPRRAATARLASPGRGQCRRGPQHRFPADGVALRSRPARSGRPVELVLPTARTAGRRFHALLVVLGAGASLRSSRRMVVRAGAARRASSMGGIVGKGASLTYAKVQLEAGDADPLRRGDAGAIARRRAAAPGAQRGCGGGAQRALSHHRRRPRAREPVRRDDGRRPPARRQHAADRARHRQRHDPRALQERHRRRGRGRLPGQDHRRAGRARRPTPR